ncbi:S1C family serine protease [Halopelagius fulvigenes]|uniref:S1C family serine protease n=1 Tax=Halopelagius fulvigenes TaxID=1198324 RepID=A0ABD5TT85_9EURY
MVLVNYRVVGVVLLLLTAGTGVAGASSVGTDGSTEENRLRQTGVQTQAQAQCDYTKVYNQTIDSVVAVRTESGLGSGFAYAVSENNSTSHVVTNAHVVGESNSVVVQFARGESKLGTVVGRDKRSDLAVVRVNETPAYVESLPVAESPPDRGARVAALGSPFGFEETITHGIVSGTNRSMPTTRGFAVPNVVQTDAPINPGNSGGPLVTCGGDVVGVNTAGISASRGENIGFAISASLIERVVPSLVRTGEYKYSYLGVAVTETTPPLASANGLNSTEGVYVTSTVPGTPAADTLRETREYRRVGGFTVPVGGDVIVAVDGRQIQSPEDLSSYLVTETQPGETVTLTVVRDGERRQVNVTLAERPEPRSG